MTPPPDAPIISHVNNGAILGCLISVFRLLLDIQDQLDRVERRVKMAVTKADFDAFRDAINAEVARVVEVIKDLIAKQEAGGLTAAEEEAVAADIQSELDNLKTVGAAVTPPAAPASPVFPDKQ